MNIFQTAYTSPTLIHVMHVLFQYSARQISSHRISINVKDEDGQQITHQIFLKFLDIYSYFKIIIINSKKKSKYLIPFKNVFPIYLYRALLSKEINIDLKIAPDHPAFLNIVHAGFVYTSDGGFGSFFIFLFLGGGGGRGEGEGGSSVFLPVQRFRSERIGNNNSGQRREILRKGEGEGGIYPAHVFLQKVKVQ